MAPPQYSCDQCGSTVFEETDAVWYCENGHAQEGGQQVGEDEEDFVRAGKVSRQHRVKEKQKVSKIQRGSKGYRLFLKAWQYILWRQCFTLIREHDQPQELWSLVRGLWGLWLSQLTHHLEDGKKFSSARGIVTSSSDSETELRTGNDPVYSKKTNEGCKTPSLPDTIALNYIGIMLLHQPIRLSTIYSLIRKEKICYIRAIAYVPKEIQERLSPEYRAALDTTTIPQQEGLQLAVYRNMALYKTCFGMIFPPFNWVLALIDRIQSLALPLEVFPTVKHLAGMLGLEFTYPQNHNERRNAITYPEAQLMALVVVATKLLYPFNTDSVKINPQAITEPAAIRMDWQTWLDARRQDEKVEGQHAITPEKAIEVTDAEVLKMSNNQLDQYMDWFQKTYVKEVEDDNMHKQILDMFPLHDPTYTAFSAIPNETSKKQERDKVEIVQAHLKPQRVIVEAEETQEDNITRPGQRYQQFRTIDRMTEPAVRFHEEAADLACLSVESLLRACLRAERLLLLRQYEQRRSEYFHGDKELESD